MQSNRINDDPGMLKSRNLWSGIFLGIGFVAFIDEAVFHQLLHWHHFYDRSTTSAGLISDGFFHAFSWVATVGSLFMLSAVRSVKGWMPRRWTAGMLLGIGGFQLYDGIVQHKWMRLHQIRYTDNVFVYDLVWNSLALLILIVGFVLLAWSKKSLAQKQADET